MALNLVTPQYKPDVIGAAKAGEQITASMASTNLAERTLAERQRQYDADYGLRSEAQSVSLASQQQAMAHKERLLPIQERALNESLISKQLDNALAASTMEDKVLGQKLENEARMETIAGAAANRESTLYNLSAKREDRAREEATRGVYEASLVQLNQLYNAPGGPNMKAIDEFQIPASLTAGQRTSLLGEQSRLMDTNAGLEYDLKADRLTANMKAVEAASIGNLAKLKDNPVALKYFQGPHSQRLGLTDQHGQMTASGDASVQRLLKAQSFKAVLGSEWDQFAKVGKGEFMVAGDVDHFIPDPETLKAMSKRHGELVTASRVPSQGETIKYKNTSGAEVTVHGVDANKLRTDVVVTFKALMEHDSELDSKVAWGVALKQNKIASGDWAYVVNADDLKAKMAAGEIEVGDTFYDETIANTRTIKPSSKQGKSPAQSQPDKVDPDFDPLPDFKSSNPEYKGWDTRERDVYKARKRIYKELVEGGGASHKDARHLLLLGNHGVFRSTHFLEDDYDADMPVSKLANQSAGHYEFLIKDYYVQLGHALRGIEKDNDFAYDDPAVRSFLPHATEDQARAIVNAEGKLLAEFPRIHGVTWTPENASLSVAKARLMLDAKATAERFRQIEKNLK